MEDVPRPKALQILAARHADSQAGANTDGEGDIPISEATTGPLSGRALVNALQAFPHPEVELSVERFRMPVRRVAF
ncbi:MAG: hypothetical protein PW843_15315 [Azospirillaceae bacterium]|nr:hypothetical protein [Azospirillaceae bacterium]